MRWLLRFLEVRQQAPDLLPVDGVHRGLAGVAARPARRLDLEVVAAPGVDANHGPGARGADPLLGRLVALHLRHVVVQSPVAGAAGVAVAAPFVGAGAAGGLAAAAAAGAGAGAGAGPLAPASAVAAGSALGRGPPSGRPGRWGAAVSFGVWVDARTMNNDLRSSTGCRSMTPCSLTCSENRSNSTRPSSGWLSSRPRKRTVTLI